jgi:hypothetical protein
LRRCKGAASAASAAKKKSFAFFENASGFGRQAGERRVKRAKYIHGWPAASSAKIDWRPPSG